MKSETKRRVGDWLKPARVIQTGCFGICPKRAVVVTGGSAAGQGDYVLISSASEAAAAIERMNHKITPCASTSGDVDEPSRDPSPPWLNPQP